MRSAHVILAAALGLAPGARGQVASPPLVSTFSILALDPANGDLGVAVRSKFPNARQSAALFVARKGRGDSLRGATGLR